MKKLYSLVGIMQGHQEKGKGKGENEIDLYFNLVITHPRKEETQFKNRFRDFALHELFETLKQDILLF